jgi:hypothetical protein
MPRRNFWCAVTILLGCVLGLILPAHAQRGGRAVGTPVSATYKGLTTTRSYQPLPTTAPGPATEGGPTLVTTCPAIHVVPISDELRRAYRIDPFYTKTLTIRGIVVMGSDKVSDWALLEAAYTLDHQFMNSPKWVIDGFASTRVRLSIIADVEYTMDLPENQEPAMIAQGAYNDQRSRGLGGFPWCSCAEENLLNLRGDPYGGNGRQGSGENITIHEFSHTTGSMIRALQHPGGAAAGGGRSGRGGAQGPWGTKMDAAYAKSTSAGGRLFAYNQANGGRVYASNDWQEFWAEGAQAWFDNANPRNSGGLSVRNDVKTKDPDLAELLTEVYGDGDWRYIKTTARKPDGTPLRPPSDMEHLLGLDAVRNQYPPFSYSNSPRIIAAAQSGGGTGRGRGAGPATAPATSRPAVATATPTVTAPAIMEVQGVVPNERAFTASGSAKPIAVRSEKEAADYFAAEELAKLVKLVDFKGQIVLIFAWQGSGQDKLDYTVAESFPEQITFTYTPGLTKDLHPHTHIYALRANVVWNAK